MERKRWIDLLRGLCMIAILAFHTEVYYKEDITTPYYIYTTNAITLFYFISGYLFYSQRPFNIVHKLKSIVRSLLVPYFIFTTAIAYPKAILHEEQINIQDILLHILTGHASWFIVALMVAEVIFSLILWISKGKTGLIATLCLICFVIYLVVPFHVFNYWQWQNALLAVLFLFAGWLYHKHEALINTINLTSYSPFILIILILIKVYEYRVDYPMDNIAITNYPLFFMDNTLSILFLTSVVKQLPSFRTVEWTGRHCIVYYFLCGGCPLIVSLALRKIHFSYDGHLYRYVLAFVLCYLLASLLTWLIYRYVPFITGKRQP